jgi:hypothetical protein
MKSVELTSSGHVPVLLSALHRLDHSAEALREACQRRKWLVLGVVSSVYFFTTWILASNKPMWNDEMFTYFIARAPTLSSVWSALLTGADQNPFPFYILSRWSLSLFGGNELALRLPEMIGVWGAGFCLFLIVARLAEPLYGFVAMVFLFVTGANFYSYEARPYGLVLAFSSLAWLFWQQATDGRRRRLSLLGLAGSLAAAVCSHYYAVFVLVPLGVGELIRSLVRRRVEWPIWLAMMGALSPLLFMIPLIQQASSYSQGFWARPSLGSIPEAYSTLLMPASLLALVSVFLGGSYMLTHSIGSGSRSAARHSPIPPHEIAAAVGFVALPIITVLATMMTTGAFTFRYALPTVLGVCVLVALTMERLFREYAFVGMAIFSLLCVGFCVLSVRNLQGIQGASLGRVYDLIGREPDRSLPVVVSDAHSFMSLSHYAPRELSSRLVYLADPKASLRHLGYDTVDRGILDLKPWFGFHIEEYGPYLQAQPKFLVYVSTGRLSGLNWLLTELASAPYQIELRARIGDHLLFLVTSKAISS